jgi:hypothetical protein
MHSIEITNEMTKEKVQDKILELITLAIAYENRGLRRGQSLYIALNLLDKRLANKICASEFDCFYDDKKILYMFIENRKRMEDQKDE